MGNKKKKSRIREYDTHDYYGMKDDKFMSIKTNPDNLISGKVDSKEVSSPIKVNRDISQFDEATFEPKFNKINKNVPELLQELKKLYEEDDESIKVFKNLFIKLGGASTNTPKGYLGRDFTDGLYKVDVIDYKRGVRAITREVLRSKGRAADILKNLLVRNCPYSLITDLFNFGDDKNVNKFLKKVEKKLLTEAKAFNIDALETMKDKAQDTYWDFKESVFNELSLYSMFSLMMIFYPEEEYKKINLKIKEKIDKMITIRDNLIYLVNQTIEDRIAWLDSAYSDSVETDKRMKDGTLIPDATVKLSFADILIFEFDKSREPDMFWQKDRNKTATHFARLVFNENAGSMPDITREKALSELYSTLKSKGILVEKLHFGDFLFETSRYTATTIDYISFVKKEGDFSKLGVDMSLLEKTLFEIDVDLLESPTPLDEEDEDEGFYWRDGGEGGEDNE